MKIKISNYIAARLVEAGICQAFMVTGGGAMHLNDALGHQEGLHCIYNHHEQASAKGRRLMRGSTTGLPPFVSPRGQGEPTPLPEW